MLTTLSAVPALTHLRLARNKTCSPCVSISVLFSLEVPMHLRPLRDALNKMAEPNTHKQLENAAAKLTPEEAAAVHSGDPEKIKAAATAAPGGFLAIIMQLLSGIASNPAVLQILLTLLGQLIPIPKPTP